MRRIIFLFIIFTSLAFPQSLKNYYSLIDKSDNLIYDFQFGEATDLLYQAIQLNPERPEAYQLFSKVYLWFYLGSKDALDKEHFENYSDSVVKKCKSILEVNDRDKKILYELGNAYKFKAMMSAAVANSLDAFWATKNAVGYYEDVLDIDSTFYSAYGGIGIFEYALSFVPAFFTWALTITGLSANENNGFEYVAKAYKFGKQDKIEFQFHYAKLYDEYLTEYEKSIKLLDPLIKQFPNNSLFLYQRAIEFIKSKNLLKAEQDLKSIIKDSHPKFAQTLSFSKFLLGDVYFRQNKYELALGFYKQFLKSTQTIDYTGIASLRAAICNHFLGDSLEFRKYAILASNGNQDIEEDDYAKDFSINLLADGFSRDREIQIDIENTFLAGNYKKVVEKVNSVIDSIEVAEVTALLLNYKTSSLIELRKLKEAKQIANELRNYELQNSFWIKPMAFVNLAKINMIEKNYPAVKQYILAASEFNNYSRKNLIKSYINKIKNDLKN